MYPPTVRSSNFVSRTLEEFVNNWTKNYFYLNVCCVLMFYVFLCCPVCPKNTRIVLFLNVCCVMVFYVFLCRSVFWLLYGPFCHGVLTIDLHSTNFLIGHFYFAVISTSTTNFVEIFSVFYRRMFVPKSVKISQFNFT